MPISGLYNAPAGSTTTNDYDGAIVLGAGGNETFQTGTSGGTYEGSFFFGDAGNDRLIVKAVDAVIGGNVFNGGDGIDTLELYSSTAITMTSFSGGATISYGNGNFVSATNVERFVITGSDFVDSFSGSAGDDWLVGGKGVDLFQGSAGNDGYVFDSSDEFVSGADAGIDTIWSTASQDLSKSVGVENLRLQGSAETGFGNDLANVITGTAGDNTIGGGAGIDTLSGKGGADTFVFAHFGSDNRDVIYDFGADDKIQLDSSVFTGLTANGGVLDASDFVRGTTTTDTDATIFYNSKTGVLSYDSDGAGANAAQEIAVIGKNLAFFDHNDILLA